MTSLSPNYLIYKGEKKIVSTRQICWEDLQREKCLPQYMALLCILLLLLSLQPAGVFRFRFQEAWISPYRLYYEKEHFISLHGLCYCSHITGAALPCASSSPFQVGIRTPLISRQVRLSPTTAPRPEPITETHPAGWQPQCGPQPPLMAKGGRQRRKSRSASIRLALRILCGHRQVASPL